MVLGGAGDDVLVRRITRALIGLEHAVAEHVLLRQGEIRRHFCGVDVLELRMRRRAGGIGLGAAADRDLVGAIHPAAVVHGQERRMGVAQIVRLDQRHRRERDGLAMRVDAAAGDVGVGQAMEQVIRRTVLLHDDDDMLDPARIAAARTAGSSAAAGEAIEQSREQCRAHRHTLVHILLRPFRRNSVAIPCAIQITRRC